MTNKIALFLGALILVAVGVDQAVYDGTTLLFLLRKLVALIEWMAFWR
ncbi:hypothetical protein [Roseovarius sp. SYSU LYC5161]|jgi:hypothetical protein|nr:hypothetical protein [Roseovarius sp.]